MRGEIVVDLRAGCSKLVVDSVRALSDESLFSFKSLAIFLETKDLIFIPC